MKISKLKNGFYQIDSFIKKAVHHYINELEKRFKRFLYKKYLLEKDLAMAIQQNSLERVKRIVPKHSVDIFMEELKKTNPHLLK